MKIHKVITSISLFVITAILLVGCGKEPSIVGKWEIPGQEGVLEFKEDGVAIGMNGNKVAWELSDDGKELILDNNSYKVAEFTDEALTLKLGSNEMKLSRVD